MRILFINTYYYPDLLGGTEVSIKKLAEGLSKLGNEVTVLVTGTKEMTEMVSNVMVRRIKINNVHSTIDHKKCNRIMKILYRIIDIYNIFNYFKLKNEIKKINPDIVNVNNIYGISPIVYKVIDDLKIKCIATLRDYYLICPKVFLLRNGQTCDKPNFICKIYRRINKRFLKRVDYFTAPSQFVISEFMKYGLLDKSNSKVIYNAIDINEDEVMETIDEKLKREKNIIKFIYLGALEKHKGLEILVNAFSKNINENISLYIAGKGTLQDMVVNIAERDTRIKYLGFLNEDNLKKVLLECDVLIAPSLWNEPFGRIVLDAYKYGLPVITSMNGGLDEIVDNYITGIKLEKVTEANLNEAINYYINNDFSDFIRNCKEKIKLFGIEKQVKEFNELYIELKEE